MSIRHLCILTALTLAATPALADEFARVEIETSAYDGDQPAGQLLWQTVSVSWNGEVDIRHFSAFHSDRFSGVTTVDEMRALEAAVRSARLGDGIGATYSTAPWSEKFSVEGGPASLTGETKGEVNRAGALKARLAPLKAIALEIAERLVHPPALPDGQLKGRVEASGVSTELVIYGERYRVYPEHVARSLAALDGQTVRIAGERTRSSGWFATRRVEISDVLEPSLADLRGTIAPGGDLLRVGDRDVAVVLPEDLEEVFAHLHGDLTVRGFVRPGPRGPRSIALVGVLATMTDDSYPLDAGDDVLITEHLWSDRFRAERVSDGDRTSVDRGEFEPRHGRASGGMIGGLGR